MLPKKYILSIAFLCLMAFSFAFDYSTYFYPERVRMNYSIVGTHNSISIRDISCQKEYLWGGSRTNLIDTFRYGQFMFEIYDLATKELIYSRGYSNLFQEWQSTAEAKVKERSFNECMVFPAPIKSALIRLYSRDSNLVFQQIMDYKYNPNLISLSEESIANKEFISIHGSASPEKALDIVFVSEGYTIDQEEKFIADVRRFKDDLFKWLPYSNHRDKINIKGVFVPSEDAGVDIPGDSIWKDTPFDCRFYTFGIERYLSVPDLTKVYDKLVGVPFDQVCVLVNSDMYGGGGIFNFYNIFTSDHYKAGFLFVHEFGHSFSGLADEYFSTEVAYEKLVRTDIEPVEPNITTLVDFKQKWKTAINDTIPVPTPDSAIYNSVIGAFEGAAYKLKGVYRPALDCAMRSSTCNKFCEICQHSIEQMILFYAE